MTAQSSNEILDIINDADETVGSATRHEIHRNGFMHRAVHIFVFNHEGKIYVQRRVCCKDSHPLKLDSSAAGHVDSGEDYHEAAIRELFEELNIGPQLIEELRYGPAPETDNERVALYSCICDIPPIPNPDEILSADFWSPTDLTISMSNTPEDFVPAFVILWTLFRNKRL